MVKLRKSTIQIQIVVFKCILSIEYVYSMYYGFV